MPDEEHPTYRICRYDPEKKKAVAIREGMAEPVDPATLNPEVREYFEKFIAEHGKRKSA